MDGLKTFFKARKQTSLEGASPSDAAFILAQDSESPISPPSQEGSEVLDMLRVSWRVMYDEATDLDGIVLAEDVKAKGLLAMLLSFSRRTPRAQSPLLRKRVVRCWTCCECPGGLCTTKLPTWTALSWPRT
jgi:hypothetical protein